ncbi:tetratricopeptide repeat protein 32 isoform X2 [Electrophorus electricus]|uniref:tetratricopeptide repeat protein 32 isoform X2 n=1 Tax=Electrophorus electricus TaxID=8005 RepID=UPI0015D02A6C|nr:tetratricopeptide repeat protein 32 isoform X2 [Electrophorus electricus]
MEDQKHIVQCKTILNKAHDEFNSNNFKHAEELYTEFINLCTNSSACDAKDLAVAYNNRGQVKYFRVDFYEAMDDYSAAIKANGFFQDAESDFKMALDINANFEDARQSLSQTILDREEKNEKRLLMAARRLCFSPTLLCDRTEIT